MTDTAGFGQVENAMVEATPPADNHAAFLRAQGVIPGGVNSPVRAYGSVGGDPYART
jgi:glutamate-1-semialdehyde 2,1-aminomutase